MAPNYIPHKPPTTNTKRMQILPHCGMPLYQNCYVIPLELCNVTDIRLLPVAQLLYTAITSLHLTITGQRAVPSLTAMASDLLLAA